MEDIIRYSIIDTETRFIDSKYVDQKYQISIALPVFHSRKPDNKCPAIYVLDANFFFGIVTEKTVIQLAKHHQYISSIRIEEV